MSSMAPQQQRRNRKEPPRRRRKRRVLCVFDFDWSLINENCDTWIWPLLAATGETSAVGRPSTGTSSSSSSSSSATPVSSAESEAAARRELRALRQDPRYAVWTDLMAEVCRRLCVAGVSVAAVRARLAVIPVFPDVVNLLHWLGRLQRQQQKQKQQQQQQQQQQPPPSRSGSGGCGGSDATGGGGDDNDDDADDAVSVPIEVELLIVSDANTLFIEYVLTALSLHTYFNVAAADDDGGDHDGQTAVSALFQRRIYTNPAWLAMTQAADLVPVSAGDGGGAATDGRDNGSSTATTAAATTTTTTATAEAAAQRIHVGYYHAAAHNCQHCPRNLCKGAVVAPLVQRWRDAGYKSDDSDDTTTTTRTDTVIYVGDGGGDYCPALTLSQRDHVCARSGFTLLKKLRVCRGVRVATAEGEVGEAGDCEYDGDGGEHKNADVMAATVWPWTDGAELADIIRRRILHCDGGGGNDCDE